MLDNEVTNLSGRMPSHLDEEPAYECEACWDRGCGICTVLDPESGMLIPIKQFEDEIYESEIDELCMECHDPDCPGCNE